MDEILRTNDPVLISFVEALLRDAVIPYHVADANTSAVEGSISIFPRRVLVLRDDVPEVRRLLSDAGLASELARETSSEWLPVPARGLTTRET